VGGAIGFWAGLGATHFNLPVWLGGHFLNQVQVNQPAQANKEIIKTVEEDSAVVEAVEKVSPAVVSIIITKDLPIIERYYSSPFGGSDFWRQFFGDDFGDFFGFGIPHYRQKGTEKKEIGGGTGFIVSADGYIITNRHVVEDEDAEYTVLMNDETKHEAKVVARDPINDIAILKIEGKDLPTVTFGDSSNLKVGQTVIAIGNALGEFRNTVSKGVISGLSRSIVAGGAGVASEQLFGVIQTDASINPGNSGGPLLNIAGQVIGMNTAMAQGAENIGFAIPVNEIKRVYENVREHGKIVRPWLGVRYVQINKAIAEDNKLDVDYGALIVRGQKSTDLAVIPGSPADKAGLEENDIILEVDGKKITTDYPLSRAIAQHNPGDEITLKVLHKGEEKEVKVKLGEMK
jgi:S1-C subfamily serine protease